MASVTPPGRWGPRRSTSTGGAGVTLAGCSSSTRRIEPINVCTVRRAAVLLLKDEGRGRRARDVGAALRAHRDAAPGRHPPRDLRQGPARHPPAQDHPPRRLRPRRLDLPVLRLALEPHRRPRHPALQGRHLELGEHRRLLRAVQPPQGRPPARPGRHAPAPHAARARARTSSSTSPARRSRRPGGSGCPRRAPWPTRPEWTGRRRVPPRVAALGAGGGRRADRRGAAAREPVAGQPPARPRRRPRARAAPLGAPGLGGDDPDLTAAREALVLARLAGTAVAGARAAWRPTPTRRRATSPALLLTRVPWARRSTGARRSARSSPRWPRSTPSTRPASRPTGATTSPTAWPCRRGPRDRERVGARASPLAHAPPPELPERFIHRDFHPGNTLWEGAELTGVIDWTTGSRSPAAVDLGHLRWNLGARLRPARRPTPSSPTPSTIPTTTSSPRSTSCPTSTRASPTRRSLRLEEHVARALDARS